MTGPLCEEQPDFPAIMVEAAFAGGASTLTYLHLDDVSRGRLDTATLGPDDVWEDISGWVQRVGVVRGVDRVTPIVRYDAGTAAVDLDNSDRRFDPSNLAGPYVSAGVTQVTPMRAIRIRAVFKGVTYDLMRPFADQWKIDYEGESSVCHLLATDAVKVLKNNNRVAVAAVGGGEDAGARINRILDSASWPADDRVVAAGDTTLQATTLDGPAWDELQLVAETEIGAVYVDGAGRVVFRNRHAAMEQLASMSAGALFGSGDDAAQAVSTGVNYFPNPSVEVNDDGYSAAGVPAPTVARTNTRPHSGTWGIEVTWAGGSTFLPSLWITHSGAGLIFGKTYTWSAWIYVPAGSPDIYVFEPAVTIGATITVKDTWTRITLGTNYTGSAKVLGLNAAFDGGGAGTKLFVDDVMLTVGGADQVPDYFDGGSPHSEWDGTAHASTSRRLPQLPAADVVLEYTDETLANMIRVTRVGGIEQVVGDAASQQLNLIRTHTPAAELPMQSDQVAGDYAGFLLYQCKDPELRLTELVVLPQVDPDNLYPLVLGLDFGDRIRVTYDPPGGGTVTREVFIAGIGHRIEQGEWVTVFALQSAARWSFLTLDHATLGRLDYNALAY